MRTDATLQPHAVRQANDLLVLSITGRRCDFRFMLVASMVLMGLLAWSTSGASAQAADGARLLAQNCGRCHATAASDSSRLVAAPPFRDIYRRYAVKELETMILQGAVSHYEKMPQIEFSLSDVAAIMDYLGALDARRKPRN